MNDEVGTRAEQAMAAIAGFRCEECDLVLPEDGQCTECEYAYCPYCGAGWHDECAHLVAVTGDEDWGSRPWPNQAFVVPEGIDWEHPDLAEALDEFGLGDLVGCFDEGGGWVPETLEKSALDFGPYDVSVYNGGYSPGGDSWGTYWVRDAGGAARWRDAYAERLQTFLDSLPGRFPISAQSIEDED